MALETPRELLMNILDENRVCKNCGFDDIRALQIDHIFGNGPEMRLSKPGIMKYYLENPDTAYEDLQILCANCNWIKRSVNGETRK